ncbi:hypothetical protein PC116_g663 [Phytophthora cactorum]|nr:hypothetical protein PC116_g663 [Phytophthora cactorum]
MSSLAFSAHVKSRSGATGKSRAELLNGRERRERVGCSDAEPFVRVNTGGEWAGKMIASRTQCHLQNERLDKRA